jgi:UbiD family decarboxylase
VREVLHLAEAILPPRPAALWQHRSLALEALKLGTRHTRCAPVLEVTDQPARLNELPILTTWQEDGGAFVTLPLVYTEHPTTGKHNLGMYRVQRFDDATTGMHWQIHKGGGFHHKEAEQMNRALPVTVFLGGPPALILGDRAAAGRRAELVRITASGRENKNDEESARRRAQARQ